ncbi:MAG: prephenate dehydrogenase/arogenate dehydrogenase family protein [Verrucomicrobia bacterium]|nr:prephenate dehydrogenase/arogenate dehydrogenase family protein [Verrucomicrobiota bacterium]
MHWNKITLVGVGLLGGSLGLAIKRRRLARRVEGYVRRAASVGECERLGAVDRATLDLHSAVADAGLVILCTPLAQMKPLVKQMLPALKRGAIVTDVGSVKGSVVKDLESIVAKAGGHFIGSHPMAGGEKTGVSAARADLFEHSVCVVTPTKRSHQAALRKVEKFWKAIGARLLVLTPATHDELVSRSSHLTHLVATTLVNYVLNPSRSKHQAALCANGFRDTTRIASGSPEMWRDIAVANRASLRVALDEFVRELQAVQALLRKKRKNTGTIQQLFETAKQRRDQWCAQGISPSPD